ncbi:hypothetical protein [Bifidobacterium actinocoloniiforme]|nr:hypothetical protein [Bifidobacterium actinocoloniiforme]AKV55694.1 hypothetical protein AB656_05290 [Bifidobacterium actinocoloniiforme DSM 22766]
MVWVILLVWIAVVVALVVFVLRLARGESHDRAFSEAVNERTRRRAARRDRAGQSKEATPKLLPRIAGTAPSFTPQEPRQPLRRAQPYIDDEDTMEHPVYVNDSSVVQMRSLLIPGSGAQAADGQGGQDGSDEDEVARSSEAPGKETVGGQATEPKAATLDTLSRQGE